MGQRLGNLRIPLITLLEAYSIPAFCFVVLSTNHNVDHIFSATYPSDWNHKTCFELIIGDVGVIPFRSKQNNQTLSAMDVLAPTTMKNAAKCDTSCELHNLVSHQNFERNLHFHSWKYVCWSVCSSLWHLFLKRYRVSRLMMYIYYTWN